MRIPGGWSTRLHQHLDAARTSRGVPGAVVGVLLDGEETVAASGVANVGTGDAVQPDTLFQLGAISKLYTTALLLQAASAGLLDLDEPVRAVLHELRLADAASTLEVTPRHLLTHTSGIEGDHLFDVPGRDDDAIARYVAGLGSVGQVHAPDELYSYCSTGFVVAGRVVEVLTGEPFDRLLRRRLTRLLGADATVLLPEQALLHRVAVGHLHAAGEDPVRQPRWHLARAHGPTGGILAPAAEVLRFARLHLDRGIGPSGSEVLAPGAIRDAFEPHADHPDGLARRGLGWTVQDWDGVIVASEDGDTFGQRAALRVVPERRAAVVVLTNSAQGKAVADDVVRWVAAELLDLEAPPLPAPVPGAPVPADEVAAHVGTYDRLHQRAVVTSSDGKLRLRVCPDDAMGSVGVHEAVFAPLEPLGGGRYLTEDPRVGCPTVVTFLDPEDTGRSTFLHVGERAHRLVPTSP